VIRLSAVDCGEADNDWEARGVEAHATRMALTNAAMSFVMA
jgi:hypothetical protein